jgi:hypothetical protein
VEVPPGRFVPGAVPSRAVTPLVAIVAGLVALAAGTLLLRSYGPRMRVGRLLAVTPTVEISAARAMAVAGDRRYVRVDGRLDADEPFPDEHERPLVFRRRRLEARHDAGWTLLDQQRQTVPVRLREGLDEIGIDVEALDVGLVTLVRESLGTAAEAATALPGGPAGRLPGDTPVRLQVEQLSAVEHATVLGVPHREADGTVTMTAGTGRPLVVCTLERDEAMRVIAGGRRARPVAAAVALGGGLLLLAVGLAWALVAGGPG